jgi:hypothetical protein
MRPLSKLLLGTAAGASVLAFSALGASAAIVCNEDACWHTSKTYDYPDDASVTVHPDNWSWGPNERFRWREPPRQGPGYWQGDRWVEFEED